MTGKLLSLGVISIFLLGPATIAADHSVMLIADFGVSVQTQQSGFFRCMGGQPDQIADDFVVLGQPTAPAWRISLSNKAASSGAGVLIPLYDETATGNPAVQIARRGNLTARLLGRLGRRRLRVELVPVQNPEGAGQLLGVIEASRIDADQWRTVRLPLAKDRQGPNQVSFIRILAEGDGAAWFAIDSLTLSFSKDNSTESKHSHPQRLRKAVWFWDTEVTLPDPSRRAALLELCHAQGITDLYCQIPYSYEAGEIRLRLIEEQRAFNAAAAAQGTTTHALDGSPEYIFSENHPRMLRLLGVLGTFNKESLPGERYRAIHLDNEPYVLPGWRNDNQRPQIIREYIGLNKKLRDKTSELGMEFGVDIPFWWDDRDKEGTARFTYDSEAGKQPILEALFPLLDNVGIMSYRDRVTGPNGLVAHCLDEFKLGQKFGVEVFASVELGVGKAVDKGTTFGVYDWAYFRHQWKSLERILSHQPGCAGLAIHHAQPFAAAMK
jgi:hypothetical protein